MRVAAVLIPLCLFVSPCYAGTYVSCPSPTTEVTTAFQAALSGDTDVFFDGACLVDELNIVNDGTRLVGRGLVTSILILKSGANKTLLKTNGKAVILRDFRMAGNSTSDKRFEDPPADSRHALEFNPQTASSISGLSLDDFDGTCLKLLPLTGADNFGPHATMGDIRISNCSRGAVFSVEYIGAHDFNISRSGTAVEVRAGNVNILGFVAANNRINAHVIGTGITNNGHGSISSSILNHASYSNVIVEDITLGFNFVSCQFHLGPINIFESSLVSFRDSIFQVNGLTFGGTGGTGPNVIENNTMLMLGDNLNVVTHNQGSDDATIVRNNLTNVGRFPVTHGDLVDANGDML